LAPDGAHAYVANQGSNNVSVIARSGNMVVATVPVGTGAESVAVTPDGKHVYVANRDSANVSVIRTATNRVVATIPVGSIPFAVSISAQ
jgi:YVTN family beta-propeller protein